MKFDFTICYIPNITQEKQEQELIDLIKYHYLLNSINVNFQFVFAFLKAYLEKKFGLSISSDVRERQFDLQ